MTPAEATVLGIIQWALNPKHPSPQIEELPEDLLMERAIHHRIVGPLLSRLDAARPPWCPAHVRTQLRIRQHRTRMKTQAQIAAAREMSRALVAHGQPPPLFIKGFAAYALTGSPDTLHESSDLDPFAADLPKFEAVLHELGYTGKRKDKDDWHEWGEYQRDGIALDVHQFFPVMAYPAEVSALSEEQLNPERNPGHWQMSSSAEFREAHLCWHDLEAGAAPGIAATGTEDIWFPSPEVLCLIQCAHVFRQCMTQTQHMDNTGAFRLYEMLSVYHLARLPRFDTNRFAAQAAQFLVQDAVRFVNSLAVAVLGVPAVPGQSSDPHLPERLVHGGWVSLQQPEEWLFERQFETMLNQLGASDIPLRIPWNVSRLPRLLTYGSAAWSSQQVEFEWDEAAETLVLFWHLDHTHTAPAYHSDLGIHFAYRSSVRLNFGSAWELSQIDQKDNGRSPSRPATAELFPHADQVTLRLVCPMPLRSQHSPVDADFCLPLLLVLFQSSAAGQAAAYLPLHLVFLPDSSLLALYP